MITPDNHPHADELTKMLCDHFDREAYAHLAALKTVLGNTSFMRVMEAFGFIHFSIAHERQDVKDRCEGMRHLVLLIQAARHVTDDDLKEALNGQQPTGFK